MYVKIKPRTSLGNILRYHDRKVKQGRGECLYAGNMLKEAPELTLREKQFYFERLHSLNDVVRQKTLHIFLSWHPDDILDDSKMRAISREFMQEMKLGKQPYLVYRHWDTPHAHAHIITTNIRSDGSHIVIWRKERLQSMQLSQQLEMKYGLHQASKRLSDVESAIKYPLQKVIYGVTPLNTTMNSVLNSVLRTYKYTNLEELNAVLNGYNIRAVRGSEYFTTRGSNALLYFPLQDSGERVDVYIKSSALRSRPTLRVIQKLFKENMDLHAENRQRMTTAIDWIFHKQPISREGFRQALKKEKIRIVEDRPEQKLFYIDELAKTVYEGERLGRQYSLVGIQDRCVPEEVFRQQQSLKQEQKQSLRRRPNIEIY